MYSEEAGLHLVAASVGFLSLLLLWLAVVIGLVLRNSWLATRVRRQTVYGTHQILALVGLTLAAVHVFAQLTLPGTDLRLADAMVPFAYWRDPIGIGTGVLAWEISTAVAVSILVQRWLGYSRWRALHRLTYPAYMLAVAHVLISGTDVAPTWIWSAVFTSWLVVALLWLSTARWVIEAGRRVGGWLTTAPTTDEITINVDPTRCARFGFCEHEAPGVFVLHSDGLLSYRAVVTPAELGAVTRAVEVCPARAISVGAAAYHTSPHPGAEA